MSGSLGFGGEGSDALSECLDSPSEFLFGRIADGDRQALDDLLAQHRDYVRGVVANQLGPQLRTRVDPSDIVQDSLLIASRRIGDFLERRPTSFRNWLYRLVHQRVIDTYRCHLAGKRDVRLEAPLGNLSAASIVDSIFGERASEIVRRKELLAKVDSVVAELKEKDREMLALLYTESLSNGEVAEILDMQPNAISQRHGRVIRKLADILSSYEL